MIRAETSCPDSYLPSLGSDQASPLSGSLILYETRPMSLWTSAHLTFRLLMRLTAKKVLSGLVAAWRLAEAPTRTSPSFVYATIDGVVRSPSLFSMTLALPPSMIATHELVVPRSMPMIFAMRGSLWILPQ